MSVPVQATNLAQNLPIQEASASITSTCSSWCGKIVSVGSWVVSKVASVWSNYLSPALATIASGLSKGFSASKDLVQAHPIAAVASFVGVGMGYLVFRSKQTSKKTQ